MLLLLCKLAISNNTILASKPLYVSCDASLICGSYIAFQLEENGSLRLVSTNTKIFIRSARNKSSAFRELLAILSSLLELEMVIRSHYDEVVILSDSISLSLLYRQRYSNSKLLEISIFISSFSNVSISYLPGSQIFFADILTRQYNRIFLDDNDKTISKHFAKLIPPPNKNLIGQKISNEQLID